MYVMFPQLLKGQDQAPEYLLCCPLPYKLLLRNVTARSALTARGAKTQRPDAKTEPRGRGSK